jgi:hypothetical protein
MFCRLSRCKIPHWFFVLWTKRSVFALNDSDVPLTISYRDLQIALSIYLFVTTIDSRMSGNAIKFIT